MQIFGLEKIRFIKPDYSRYVWLFNKNFGSVMTLPENPAREQLESAAAVAAGNGKEYLALALLEAAGYANIKNIKEQA